jgi:DNA repair protein RecN (Recombination protein N)
MLQKLYVNNYVIIDELEINFSNSLNMVTGETGAGKSVLLGALSLVLGQRADTKVLYNIGKKCVIEATFNIASYNLESFFTEHQLDFDKQTLLRREISDSGKSRAFINDTPVNLNVLKELGEQLVNVHSQHETLSLNNAAFQIDLIDNVAKQENNLKSFSNTFNYFKQKQQELQQLQNEYDALGGDASFLKFQLSELSELALKENEQESLEQELKTLEHAEEIKGNISKAMLILNDSDAAVNSQLLTVLELFENLKKYQPEMVEIYNRINSTYIELQDIAETIEKIADNTTLNAERIEEVQARLNLIYRLHKKHKTIKIEELLAIEDNLQQKINAIENFDERLQKLHDEISKLKNKLIEQATILHQNRKNVITAIENKVKQGLQYVAMPDATFQIDIQLQEFDKIHEKGLDKIRFLFSANKGLAPDELKKVASGGELSRLMLIIKSLAAQYAALPTLIFDEIDTGISGEVADKVGKQMQALAKHHQVIAITHLPQIAGKGNCHFYVYKDNSGAKTITRIKQLNEQERVVEIAKMLVGDKVTESALSNAKELMN